MNVTVDLDALLDAHEWVSAGEVSALDGKAFIHRLTGIIYWVGEGVEEEPPEDIEDGTLYIAVPSQSEFNLGRALAIRFVEEHLPRSVDTVYDYFRRRGAYARFKDLLDRAGQLDAWHAYEQRAKEEALSEWCAENGLTVSRKTTTGDRSG
jgi:hypothetical protein